MDTPSQDRHADQLGSTERFDRMSGLTYTNGSSGFGARSIAIDNLASILRAAASTPGAKIPQGHSRRERRMIEKVLRRSGAGRTSP